MSRLLAVVLTLLMLATSLPTGTAAQGTARWTIDADTERVELQFRSGDLTADEVEFTIKDRTGLVLLVGELPAAVLEALGLRTGYSQVATWQAGAGPIIACPSLGSNLWCESEAGAGLALVPNPGRAILLATALEAPGRAELTVMVSERSLGFDLAVVAVGLALSVVAGETAKTAAMKVASEVVFDLVIRVLPEAMATAAAFLDGDYDAAVASLGALVLVAAQLITENAAYWTAVLGIAVITKLVPFLHEVELMLAAAKAVPAIFTLVAAMGNSERTTVRLSWEGVGEEEEAATSDAGMNDDAVFVGAAGQESWSRQFGGPDTDRAVAVSVDQRGNVYVVGWLDEVEGQQSGKGFVRSYDQDGNERWHRDLGGGANGVALGEDGDLYVGAHDGAGHALLTRYGEEGREEWTDLIRVNGRASMFDIAVGPDGTVMATGVVSGPLPGEAHAGDFDGFVRAYGADGRELWSDQFGSPDYDVAGAVAVDADENVYVVGFTFGALDGHESAERPDAFVRKYDRSGSVLWTDQFGSSDYDAAKAVAVDADENAYVVGWTRGVLDGQDSAGHDQAFVRKYDRSGKVLWTAQYGESGYDDATAVALDPAGVVRVLGNADNDDGGWRPIVTYFSPQGKQLQQQRVQTATPGTAHDFALEGSSAYVVVGSNSDAYVTKVVETPWPETDGEASSSLSVGAGPVSGQLTDERPAADHQLSAEVGDQLGISMRSTDFDAYLQVLGPDGSVLAENDDAPSSGQNPTDSYVEFTAATTDGYTVVASSYQYVTNAELSGVGGYQLEISAVTGVAQLVEEPQAQHSDGAGGFVRVVFQDQEFYFADPTCVMDVDGSFLRVRQGTAPAHAVQLTVGRGRTEDLRLGGQFPISGLDWWEGLQYGDQTPRGGSVDLDVGGMSGSFDLTWWGGTAYGEFRCP